MELLRTLLRRAWYEDHGVLSFEWTLVITLLVIGIVGWPEFGMQSSTNSGTSPKQLCRLTRPSR